MEERGDTPWSVRTYLILIIGVAALAIAAATVYGYLWSAGRARSSAESSMRLEAQRAEEKAAGL